MSVVGVPSAAVSSSGQTVLLTGGAGYVGAALAPQLLADGWRVRILDLYLYGKTPLNAVRDTPGLEEIEGDIRDRAVVKEAVEGVDAVLHLACISNDPSFELDPALGKSINFDAFEPLVDASRAAGVRRFIYASSASVYGISDAPEVDEDHPLNPLTDYSRFKAMCEPILLSRQADDFTTLVVRPATLCGYSPRLRLDLTVNILTNHAYHRGAITVFGGSQLRPHIHLTDLCRYYRVLLRAESERIAGRTYNAGYQNNPVSELAEIVRDVVQRKTDRTIEITTTPTDDPRSYHIVAKRIAEEQGLRPEKRIEDAVAELVDAFEAGLVPDAMTDDRYFNVKLMKRVALD